MVFPSLSLPIQPMAYTNPPSLPAPTAWLAPFPPGKRAMLFVISVSPSVGILSTLILISIFILPITTIFLLLLLYFLKGLVTLSPTFSLMSISLIILLGASLLSTILSIALTACFPMFSISKSTVSSLGLNISDNPEVLMQITEISLGISTPYV